jgi:hypothetical protein
MPLDPAKLAKSLCCPQGRPVVQQVFPFARMLTLRGSTEPAGFQPLPGGWRSEADPIGWTKFRAEAMKKRKISKNKFLKRPTESLRSQAPPWMAAPRDDSVVQRNQREIGKLSIRLVQLEGQDLLLALSAG